MCPLETALNVDFEAHHVRKRWGPGLLSIWYLPSPTYDTHLSFSLLLVFSNHTTVSLFRWQLHSKRQSSHPSAGIGCSSDFKAQSKVFSLKLFFWEHADRPNGLPSNVPGHNKITSHPGSSPDQTKVLQGQRKQMPCKYQKIMWCLLGLSALFLPLCWSSSRRSGFTLDWLQIKRQCNNLCASLCFGFKTYN